MDKILEQLQEIFRTVLEQPDLVLTRESDAHNIEDWDSLSHVNLVTAIEKKYKIKFALGELQDLKHVGDMMELIQTKLDQKMGSAE
jgi:acyl carrier protein